MCCAEAPIELSSAALNGPGDRIPFKSLINDNLARRRTFPEFLTYSSPPGRNSEGDCAKSVASKQTESDLLPGCISRR